MQDSVSLSKDTSRKIEIQGISVKRFSFLRLNSLLTLFLDFGILPLGLIGISHALLSSGASQSLFLEKKPILLGILSWLVIEGVSYSKFRKSFGDWLIKLQILAFLSVFFVFSYFSVHLSKRLEFFLPAKILTLPASFPSETGHRTLPFFYSLGTWPTILKGKEILYFIPYIKGPPERFIPQIETHWGSLEANLIIGGPQTPTAFLSQSLSRLKLKECLTQFQPFEALRCQSIKRRSLQHALKGFSDTSVSKISLQWFEVESPQVPKIQQTQGILIRSESEEKIRFSALLITEKGVHQTLSLITPSSVDGHQAQLEFETILRGIRMNDDIGMGRAWIDQQLSYVKLRPKNDLNQKQKKEDFINSISAEELVQAQNALVSKISVDPRNLEPFFHLAGIAVLMARYGIKHERSDWVVYARKQVPILLSFAKDMAPNDPKTQQIEQIWLETRKY